MIRASINPHKSFAKAMDRWVKPGKTGGNTVPGAPK
jgi:hypothetical protein